MILTFKSQPIALPIEDHSSVLDKKLLILESEPLVNTSPVSSKSKFKKGLAIFFHLLLIGTFIRWVSHRISYHHVVSRTTTAYSQRISENQDMGTFRNHSDLRCDSMAQWSEPEEIRGSGPRFSSDASFTLPSSSESLLFLTRGVHSSGEIQFVEDNSQTMTSGQIHVSINARFWDSNSLERADVCTLKRELGDGVGFFTPVETHHSRRYDALQFKVTVKFPKSSSDQPLVVENLETSLPLFAHYFPKANIFFKTLNVKSANLPIHADSLLIGTGEVETSDSPISGAFTVLEALNITTSNSRVTLNVTIYNADKKDSSKVAIRTTNAPLKSTITLISTSSDATGGKFAVDAHTTTSPLDILFVDAPIDSIIHLSAGSSYASVRAEMPTTFDGKYDVESSFMGESKVETPYPSIDPKGKDRGRLGGGGLYGRHYTGFICWFNGSGDRCRERRGFVHLYTSVFGATLIL